MRSLLISGLLGLASLGVMATTPNEASAQPLRGRLWARNHYWISPAYWSPDYYYAVPVYRYPPVTYYAPYYVNPSYAYYPPPSTFEPSDASGYLPMRSTPIPTPPSEVRPAAATTVAPGLVSVSMQDDSFSQSEIAVPPGTTVRWTNEGRRVHTVTSDKGLFNSLDLNPGEAFSFTFNRAGTYSYHCKHHANMRGTVTVR
jgi:plastocyanin